MKAIFKDDEEPKVSLEIIIDPFINEEPKLSRIDFLERVENVEGIRTRGFNIKFLPNDNKNLIRLENLHHIVNTGKFKGQTLTDHKLFAIGLPHKLWSWLKNTTKTTFHKQLLHWHAACYAFNTFNELEGEQFDPLILEEVKKILKDYYPENYNEQFNIDDYDDFDDEEKYEEYKSKRDNALKYYDEISKQYTGSLPPEFLKNPYRDPSSNIQKNDSDWGLFHNCQFFILISYFKIDEWIIIVERSKPKLKEFYKRSLENKSMTIREIDAMIENADDIKIQVSESDSGMWERWKYTFSNFETRGDFTYSCIPKEESKAGYVYLNQDENGATKIGWTTKIGTERISGIQTGNPTNVIEKGRFNSSNSKTEKILHKLFEAKKTREGGEWYWLTDEDIKNILDREWRMRNNIF